MKALLVIAFLLVALVTHAAPAPSKYDILEGKIVLALDQNKDAAANLGKVVVAVEGQQKWGQAGWDKVGVLEAENKELKRSWLKWYGAGWLHGGLVLFTIGLAIGSGLLARLIPEKKPKYETTMPEMKVVARKVRAESSAKKTSK